MGFLDDLGKGLNKVGKKTSDMAAVAKLKLEITKHKSAIDKKYEALGSRIYFITKEGIEPDEEVQTLIGDIDGLFETIKTTEEEIAKLSAEEAPKAKEGGFECKNCGMMLSEGTKFCGGCGNKVEEVQAEVVEATGKTCTNCGAEVGDAKFCNSCGTSLV